MYLTPYFQSFACAVERAWVCSLFFVAILDITVCADMLGLFKCTALGYYFIVLLSNHVMQNSGST